jgi:hypothetical protein
LEEYFLAVNSLNGCSVYKKESLDKAGSHHAESSGWFTMLGGEELSKSVLIANAGREVEEVGRH